MVGIGQTFEPFGDERQFGRVLKGPAPHYLGDLSHATFLKQNFVHAMRLDCSKEYDFDLIKTKLAQFSDLFCLTSKNRSEAKLLSKNNHGHEQSLWSSWEMIISINKNLKENLELLIKAVLHRCSYNTAFWKYAKYASNIQENTHVKAHMVFRVSGKKEGYSLNDVGIKCHN